MYLSLLRRSRAARARQQAYTATCPCNQTCRCHTPAPRHWWDEDPFPLLFMVAPIFLLVGLASWFGPPPQAPKRTIQVRSPWGRVGTCDVVFIKTGETCLHRLLHDECRDTGYEEARCP